MPARTSATTLTQIPKWTPTHRSYLSDRLHELPQRGPLGRQRDERCPPPSLYLAKELTTDGAKHWLPVAMSSIASDFSQEPPFDFAD